MSTDTRDEQGSWMLKQCYVCGHRLRFESNGCPQCGAMFDGRDHEIHDTCDCPRCERARRHEEA